MSARDHILSRLRAAPVEIKPMLPDVASWYASHGRSENYSQRIARLRSTLEASHAKVVDTNATDWPVILIRIAKEKGIRNLLIGTNTQHGDLLEARVNEDLQLIRYTDSIESWRTTLFDQIDAGFTLAKSAIAETGSLILWPDANEPRLMSLVWKRLNQIGAICRTRL